LDQCRELDIDLPFNEEGSSISSYTSTRNLFSEEGEISQVVETTGKMTCIWEEAYQSEEKVGTIRTNLVITTIKEKEPALALFNNLSQDLTPLPGYCEEDSDCTVAIQSFGADRSYYVEKYVYGQREGRPLPSSHTAQLVRILAGPGEYYLLELLVSHPELSPDSDYVSEMVAQIENQLDVQVAQGKPSATPK
jgi:hypothetical protein